MQTKFQISCPKISHTFYRWFRRNFFWPMYLQSFETGYFRPSFVPILPMIPFSMVLTWLLRFREYCHAVAVTNFFWSDNKYSRDNKNKNRETNCHNQEHAVQKRLFLYTSINIISPVYCTRLALREANLASFPSLRELKGDGHTKKSSSRLGFFFWA